MSELFSGPSRSVMLWRRNSTYGRESMLLVLH